MSVPQAITYVPGVPGLLSKADSASLPFVSSVPHPMAANSWTSPPMSGAMPQVLIPVWGTPDTVTWNPADALAVRVGSIWLLQETVNALDEVPWSRSPLDIARAAVTRGLSRIAELPQGVLTQHALMVAWGEFAHEIGLIQKLSQVPIPQKSAVHTPQAKVLTFLMGILTGITHLKDLNEGPHPLAHDRPAIRAWGLVSLAHYTGVSRTLAACDEKTVAAITQVLHDVSQPFIEQEVHLLLRQGCPLVIDLDLAPRRVSNTSTTFPDAEFGWQDDEVGLGYDAALAALTSPTYGRLFLAGFHYPRNPVSLPRLQKMVRAAEDRLGRHPRRRTGLVEQRLQELEKTLAQRQDWLAAQLDKQKAILARLQAEHTELTAYLAQLQADNENNPHPVTIILRIDAGFGTGPNTTWLIEMGYFVYTKAHNAQVAAGLLNKLEPEVTWSRVGKNAGMIAWGKHHITNCPYPLTVALERFHTPDGLKHSALIAYRDDGQCLTLSAWFDFYNARQIIEAGIKETNVVFKMHPLKMRSPGGIALQEQFTLFAANFVRWAAVWLRQRVSRSTRCFDDALMRVKAMVRVGANTSAWVVGKDESLLVKFDETGAYPGVELRLAGTWRVRPPILPHRKVHDFDFRDEIAPGCT